MKIVITGGIGSGKSTVMKLLRDELKDHVFYSVDEAVHEMYEDNRVKEFMTDVGVATRQEMSDLVFADAKVKVMLEALANPIIHETIDRWLQDPNVVVEFPLLYEHGDAAKFDCVVSISADVSTRIARVVLRSGFTAEKVRSIIASQLSQQERDERSDIVFDNSSDDLNSLPARVKRLAAKITTFSARVEARELINRTRSRPLTVGVVSGSFDPITHGHLYVIKNALRLVDELHIVIAASGHKTPLFSFEERAFLISQSLEEVINEHVHDRVHVEVLPSGRTLVDYAYSRGAKFIFRGLRGATDLEYEQKINSVQRDLNDHVETIYLMPPDEMTKVSSSLVKELNQLEGTDGVIIKYVPAVVAIALKKKQK